MDSSKTQQLLQSLALDFIHNKCFNTSILELLCNEQKIHASTTIDEIKTKISIIDKALLLLKQHCKSKKHQTKKQHKSEHFESVLQRNFNNMVNILVFNISAINEHYINEIQKQMSESTASQSQADLNKTFHKDKMAINFLRQQLQAYFIILTEKTQFFQQLVSDIEGRKVSDSQLGLLQTMDYLCVKYSVRNQFTERVVEILEKNQNQMQGNESQIVSSSVIKDVNHMLFSAERQADLYQFLETNSHVSFKNILSIINANYINTHPPRKIFSTAQLSGKQTIEGIIIRLIKRISKNELFNEKSQDYTPFRLLLYYFLNKHFSVYMQFNQLLKSLISNNQPLNSEPKLNILKKIQRIFRILISIENPHFCHILQFINTHLTTKYSQTVALQLIKKLLINRFLLNPSFYILYNDPDEEEVKLYVEAANVVRALFYTNKTEQLAQKMNCSQLVRISSEIIKSLEYCLKKQKDNRQVLQNSSNFLYINDKILKAQMQQFYDQVKESLHTPKQPIKQPLNLPNLVSDYSLSFSLVKNEHPSRNNLSHPVIENVSQVKFPNTNRSNNLRDNQSIRYMYEQLKGQKSHTQIPPKSPQKSLKPITKNQNKPFKTQQNHEGFGRVSQLARKQHQITNETRLYSMKLPTDRQMIEELVEMRKQYGQYKRGVKRQLEERKSRHVKKMGHLRAFTVRFNQYKEEMERDNNSLYVHMTTYA